MKKIMQMVASTFLVWLPLVLHGNVSLINTTDRRVHFSFVFSGKRCINKQMLERGGWSLDAGAGKKFYSPDGNCSIDSVKLRGRTYPVVPGGVYRIFSDGNRDLWMEEVK